ncbi:hypothetical protein [Paenibacillus sp. DMB20]|uniref:hypothetical protein n=1 Tax=Paenibacillus sp. DMB20 TaxID=1642570 RepID=UPI001F1D12F3|nr:hypothetical protein [Paenibacillus sp. DMB20]
MLLASSGRENYDYYPPSWCVIDGMIEGSGGEYMQMSDGGIEIQTEAIIAANPDKIILTHFQETDLEKIKNKLLTNPRFKNIKEIQSGNVMVADYTNAVRGSLEPSQICIRKWPNSYIRVIRRAINYVCTAKTEANKRTLARFRKAGKKTFCFCPHDLYVGFRFDLFHRIGFVDRASIGIFCGCDADCHKADPWDCARSF